jgi:hypothetical protein
VFVVSGENRPANPRPLGGRAVESATLLTELKHAVDFKMCVYTHCTTCGGYPFAKRVLAALKNMGYELPVVRSNRDLAPALRDSTTHRAVLMELRRTPRPNFIDIDLEPPLRYLIHRASCILAEAEIESILNDSWSGQVFRSMRDHYAAIEERKRQKRQLQQDQKEQNIERRRREQEFRMQRKAERDELWRQGKIPASPTK